MNIDQNISIQSDQVKLVSTFEELISTPYSGKINAIGLIRETDADFKEIANKIELVDTITEITLEDLNALNLSEKGILARNIIIEDFTNLLEFGAQPSLNLIKSYPEDQEFDFISTDVYSYHVDRSPVATDTFLCTYYGTVSDIIPNERAIQKINIPSVREKLIELYDGDETNFEDFLVENYFDMHYDPLENTTPYNLGLINLWKIAVDHPNQNVLPCVHRAPRELEELRLLLIC